METLIKDVKLIKSGGKEVNQLTSFCVFIVNFEHIFTPFFSISIADFEQVNVS